MKRSVLGKVKVHLGCGRSKKPDYINVDADPRVEPDLVATASSLPLPDNSVDLLEANHLIEHLSAWQLEATVREWHRILKDGGIVAVECPDLRKCVKWLARTRDYSGYAAMGMRGLFGEITSKNDFMTHKWGFTPETLSYLFRSLGFDPVSVRRPQTHLPNRDFRIEATKSANHAAKKPPLRVSWFLRGNESVASSRLHGYVIHRWLAQRGVASEIIFRPLGREVSDTPWEWPEHWRLAKLVRNGVAVFQKLRGPRTLELVRYLKSTGAATLYVDADYRPDTKIGLECDVVVCPSQALGDAYRKMGANRVVVIPDPVEFWLPPELSVWRFAKNSHLRIGWIGNAMNWETLTPVREVLRESEFADFQLVTISDHKDADVRWRMSLFPDVLRNFDLGVVPTGTDMAASFKSANRVTMFMAAGIPVIAGRIPAYEELIQPNVNGLLVHTTEELRDALRCLRPSDVRQRMAMAAYERVRERFSLERIGPIWLDLFTNLTAAEDSGDWLHGPPSSKDRRKNKVELHGLAMASEFEKAIQRRKPGEALLCLLGALPSLVHSKESRIRWLRGFKRAPGSVLRRLRRRVLRSQ